MTRIVPFIVLLLTGVQAAGAPASKAVNVRYDAKVPALEFATSELVTALKAAGLQPAISTSGEPVAANTGWTVIVGLCDRLKQTNTVLAGIQLVEEGFAVCPVAEKKLILIAGADARGALYGTLDLAESIEMGGTLSEVKAKTEKPSMPVRSLKLNMPGWDTFEITPEWKDDWDWFTKPDYWRAYFRMMARNRYNIFTLWHCHPYHWMVRVPKYPEATGLSDEEMDRFHKAYSFIFAEAARHGIDTYLITWNIHYPPTFAKKHNLEPVGQDAPVVRDYMREAIKAVLREYPGLTGVGTCPGEAMSGTPAENEAWLMDTYVPAILEVRGPQKFIHRYWGSEPKPMQEVFAAHYPGKVYLDLKYNGESMYSSPKPHFVDPVWLEQKPRNYDILWHLRNDDLYLFRWGNAEFARELMKHCVGPGIAGYVTGSEYDRSGPDRLYTDYGRKHQTWTQDFEKHWYRFMLWGRLGYNVDLPDSHFRKVFAKRFGPQFGPGFYDVQTIASEIMPLVESFHWNYMNFDWAGESCVNLNSTINTARDGKGRNPNYRELGDYRGNFNNIREWIFNWTIDDEEFIGIPEYVGNLMAGAKKGPGEERRQTPEEVADTLDRYAEQIEQGLKQLAPRPGMPGYEEVVSWEWDLRLLADLARYYAEKTRGGTDLLYYWCTGDAAAQQRAIAALTRAKEHWLKIVDLGGKVYTFPKVSIYPQLEWSQYTKDVDQDIAFAKGPPAFKSRTYDRMVMVPQLDNPQDVVDFERKIEAGQDPASLSGQTVQITEIDPASVGPFKFWVNTMTNRKAGYVNLQKAAGAKQGSIGYFTYPLAPSDKTWCVLHNDFGTANKVWYGGKVIFDVEKQGPEALRKGLVFLRDAKSGPLTIRCDAVEGQPWGCSPRHEYKDSYTVTCESPGPGTVVVTVKNSFPHREINEVKLTAIPWSSGWQVTPRQATVNVKAEAEARFAFKQTSASTEWCGLTVDARHGSEQHSASIFPELPGLNTLPARMDGDGFWRAEKIDGKWAMTSRPEEASPFIYYDVRKSYLYGIDKDVVLSIEYYDPGQAQEISIDYDSHLDGPGDGAFHRVVMTTTGQKGWRTQTIVLPRAKFKDREQGYADFRLSGPEGRPIRIGRVDILPRQR
jgi:hypothetical protein